jgi:hypothetical protein
MTAVELARKQLGPVIESLRAIRNQLVEIQESIPPTSQETSSEDLEGEPDAATEVRAILGNAVRDRLDPLIRDLITVAKRKSKGCKGRQGRKGHQGK